MLELRDGITICRTERPSLDVQSFHSLPITTNGERFQQTGEPNNDRYKENTRIVERTLSRPYELFCNNRRSLFVVSRNEWKNEYGARDIYGNVLAKIERTGVRDNNIARTFTAVPWYDGE